MHVHTLVFIADGQNSSWYLADSLRPHVVQYAVAQVEGHLSDLKIESQMLSVFSCIFGFRIFIFGNANFQNILFQKLKKLKIFHLQDYILI